MGGKMMSNGFMTDIMNGLTKQQAFQKMTNVTPEPGSVPSEALSPTPGIGKNTPAMPAPDVDPAVQARAGGKGRRRASDTLMNGMQGAGAPRTATKQLLGE